MRMLAILALSSILTGCAALEAVKAVIPEDQGLSVDAQIGDREINATAGDRDQSKLEVEADDVSGDLVVNRQTDKSEKRVLTPIQSTTAPSIQNNNIGVDKGVIIVAILIAGAITLAMMSGLMILLYRSYRALMAVITKKEQDEVDG